MIKFSTLFISLTVLISLCSGVPLITWDDPSPEKKSELSSSILLQLKQRGLHGEVTGKAALRNDECGEIVLDFNNYINGDLFALVVTRLVDDIKDERDKNITRKTLEAFKKDCIAESTEIFRRYSEVMPDLETSETAYKFQDALPVDVFTRPSLELRATNAYQSQLLIGMLFNDVRTLLNSRLEESLAEMAMNNRLSRFMINDDNDNQGIWKALETLMGKRRWDESLLKKSGRVAAGNVKVHVLGMNMDKSLLKISACYPTSSARDAVQTIAVVPHGRFSEDGSEFIYPYIHKHYAIPENCDSVACLEPIDKRSCNPLGGSFVCRQMNYQPDCHPGNVNTCSMAKHNVGESKRLNETMPRWMIYNFDNREQRQSQMALLYGFVNFMAKYHEFGEKFVIVGQPMRVVTYSRHYVDNSSYAIQHSILNSTENLIIQKIEKHKSYLGNTESQSLIIYIICLTPEQIKTRGNYTKVPEYIKHIGKAYGDTAGVGPNGRQPWPVIFKSNTEQSFKTAITAAKKMAGEPKKKDCMFHLARLSQKPYDRRSSEENKNHIVSWTNLETVYLRDFTYDTNLPNVPYLIDTFALC